MDRATGSPEEEGALAIESNPQREEPPFPDFDNGSTNVITMAEWAPTRQGQAAYC